MINDLAKLDISVTSATAKIFTTQTELAPSGMISNIMERLKNLEISYITTNNLRQIEKDTDQVDTAKLNKEQIRDEALEITVSMLNNITGNVDVEKVINNVAETELTKITNAILDNLGGQYRVSEV